MNLTITHQYDDIINKEYIKSKKHPPMSLYARSAQFAPFAALTGYEDAVRETGREVDEKIELSEEMKSILDAKLQLIKEKLPSKKEITFTYFVPDSRKNGGTYITESGIIKKIDDCKQKIIFADKREILIEDIIDIQT